MNRIILIHESSVHVQCLLSRSCSFSFCPGVSFLGFSEFCCCASGSLKCSEKDKCINGYCLVSNSKLFAPFLPCRAESSSDTCHLLWADSPSSCLLLSTVHSEWHEFLCFSLQLWCTFGIICTTWSECFQMKWSRIFAPCSAFVEQVCFALLGKAAVSGYWMTPPAFSFLLWLDHVVQFNHIQASLDVFCVSCQLTMIKPWSQSLVQQLCVCILPRLSWFL